jgi:hypothetical protein
MLKKLLLGSGLALAAVGMAIVPALAYSGTPGTSASTSSTTVVAGGSVTFSAHFPGGGAQAVTFSPSGGGSGCTVTFSPSSATTDASGNVTTTATFGANCSGTVNLFAIAGPQNVSTAVTVTAFPAAASLPLGVPVPFAWLAVLVVGTALVGGSLLGFRRREQGS